jgi:hypothetical protein
VKKKKKKRKMNELPEEVEYWVSKILAMFKETGFAGKLMELKCVGEQTVDIGWKRADDCQFFCTLNESGVSFWKDDPEEPDTKFIFSEWIFRETETKEDISNFLIAKIKSLSTIG